VKLTPDHKRCLAALASVIPGASTDQIMSLASGPADDAGVRKAAAMHAKNAGMCDKSIAADRSQQSAYSERQAKSGVRVNKSNIRTLAA